MRVHSLVVVVLIFASVSCYHDEFRKKQLENEYVDRLAASINEESLYDEDDDGAIEEENKYPNDSYDEENLYMFDNNDGEGLDEEDLEDIEEIKDNQKRNEKQTHKVKDTRNQFQAKEASEHEKNIKNVAENNNKTKPRVGNKHLKEDESRRLQTSTTETTTTTTTTTMTKTKTATTATKPSTTISTIAVEIKAVKKKVIDKKQLQLKNRHNLLVMGRIKQNKDEDDKTNDDLIQVFGRRLQKSWQKRFSHTFYDPRRHCRRVCYRIRRSDKFICYCSTRYYRSRNRRYRRSRKYRIYYK